MRGACSLWRSCIPQGYACTCATRRPGNSLRRRLTMDERTDFQQMLWEATRKRSYAACRDHLGYSVLIGSKARRYDVPHNILRLEARISHECDTEREAESRTRPSREGLGQDR